MQSLSPKPVTSRCIIGAHPWVYAATQPRYDITPILPQIFADMSYAGFDGIELMSSAILPDSAVERIGELSQKHKLAIIGASFGGQMWDRQQHTAILSEAETAIPRLAKLGGRTLGISVGSVGRGKPPKTPEQLDAQADLLSIILGLSSAHGIVPNLHNHTYEVENNMHDLKGTLERVPQVKLGPDLNWLLRGGVDPAAFLRQFGPQVVFLHLRDQSKDGRWSASLGEGDMDYAAIGSALHDIGFGGDAVVELAYESGFVAPRPLRDSLKMSCEFARKLVRHQA